MGRGQRGRGAGVGSCAYACVMSSALVSEPGPVTAEQLAELGGDGSRYELVHGELRSMTPAGYRHGRIALELGRRIGNHVADAGLGDVLSAETGFLLSRNPDTVRAPDVAYVRADRARDLASMTGFAQLAPDLVVEVVSPSDRASDVAEKAVSWIDAGVRLVWVVDPSAHLVTVYHPDGLVRLVRGPGAVLDGEDVLPGFSLPLSEVLFES